MSPREPAKNAGLIHSDVAAVQLARCDRCGRTILSLDAHRCPQCLGTVLEALPLSGPVKLHSFTEIHRSFPSFPTPFVLGWVDHPSGVRLLARIVDAPVQELEVGMMLEVEDEGDQDPEAHGHVGFVCRVLALREGSGS